MSLVSTYVRATDGLLYKNPELKGKGWFIIFDDDDPVELVIKKDLGIDPQKLLKDLGIKYSDFREHSDYGERCFGKGYNFKPAISYFFELTNRLDPKTIKYHEGTVKSTHDVFQGVFYDAKK